MKTLYLHVGAPKTATTAIQYFCSENQQALAERGYYYPLFSYKYNDIDSKRNGHFLFGNQYGADGKRDVIEEQRIFREGMDQIVQWFQKYDHIILSDEGLWFSPLIIKKGDVWEKVKRESGQYGFSVKIIIYLRRQDRLVGSLWNQRVKKGMFSDSVLTWEEYIEKNPWAVRLNYYEGLKILGGYFGKENIIVRRFQKRSLKNRSIYEDFLDVLGLKYNDNFLISKPARNLGLYGNAHEIKRIINEIPGLTSEDNAFFRQITMRISECHLDQKHLSMFSGEEAREFMKAYEAGNARIMEEYFEGQPGKLFEENYGRLEKWAPDSKSFGKDMVTFSGLIAMTLRKENEDLKKRMDGLEKKLNKQEKMMERIRKHPIRAAASFVLRQK